MPKEDVPGQPVALRTRRGRRRGPLLRLHPPVELDNKVQCIDQDNGIMAIVIESDQEENSHSGYEGQVEEERDQVQKDSQNMEEVIDSDRQVNYRKGRFTPQEQRVLTDAVGEFLTISGIKYEDFTVILHEKNVINTVLRKARFYQIISKALPNRSVISCYRFIKRCFRNNDKKGKWTEEETQRLVDLVKEEDKNWQVIGKIMGRSSESVYDKYKTLGPRKDKNIAKGHWQLKEFISLLLLVNRRADLKFLNEDIRQQRLREVQLNARQFLSSKQTPYNSANSILPFIEMAMKYTDNNIRKINIQGIPWSGISVKLQRRSLIQCKNKFMQLFEHAIKCQHYDDMKIVNFLLGMDVDDEHNVRWEEWEREDLCQKQAKNRFFVLKKGVKDRSHKTFREVLQEIKRKMLMKKGQKL